MLVFSFVLRRTILSWCLKRDMSTLFTTFFLKTHLINLYYDLSAHAAAILLMTASCVLHVNMLGVIFVFENKETISYIVIRKILKSVTNGDLNSADKDSHIKDLTPGTTNERGLLLICFFAY